MARSIPTLVLGLTLGSAFSGALALASSWQPQEEVAALTERLRHDNGTTIQLAQQVAEPRLRAKLLRNAQGMDQDLSRVATLLQPRARPHPATPQRPPTAHPQQPVRPGHGAGWAPVPTDPHSFQRILTAVQDTPFADDRLNLLRDASANRWFTVDQVLRLMEAMTWSSAKVETAAMLHPQIVDPQEDYRLYGALTFSSDKDALRARLGR